MSLVEKLKEKNMSFNIPNIFLAGTKAIASDVNENFNAIKDEINLQKDSFLSLKDNFENVSDYVNGNLREELISLIKACHALFCANSGHTDENGEADLLAIDTVNENRVVFKVSDGTDGALEPVTFSTATGERATRTQLAAIDMSSAEDGNYIICAKTVGSPYATKGKLYRCKKEPSMSSGDIWFDTSAIPFKAWHHNGINKYEFEDVPIGTAEISDGNLISVTTYPYNQNGFDINADTQINSSAKLVKSILHYSKPDYTSAVQKELKVSHTANEDGFLLVQTTSGTELGIENVTFKHTANGAFIYPVAKGNTYMAKGQATLYFLPHVSE